jgi:hypothetical protein
MNKNSYFREAIRNRCYSKLEWLVKLFSLYIDEPESELKIYPYALKFANNLIFFYNSTNEWEKIDDFVYGNPFFKPNDKITIDNTVCVNVDNEIETTVGRVIANCILLQEPFKDKVPYINKLIRADKDIEEVIESRLTSNHVEADDNDFNVIRITDYLKFCNNASLVEELSPILVVCATEKTITEAPGMKEFKKELLEKYGDKINDPVELANMEEEAKNYDREYIKDDPTYGKFLSGKILNIARKKLMISFGEPQTFDPKTKVKPITTSLSEGIPTDKEGFSSMVNDVRIASYARGSETQNGGVWFKNINRAISNVKIVDIDCGTDLGIDRYITSSDYSKLVGLYIIEGDDTILIKDKNMAFSYINKMVTMRTPGYCKLAGERSACRVCIGERMFSNPNQITLASNTVSERFITISLKQMHGKVLATQKLDLERQIT